MGQVRAAVAPLWFSVEWRVLRITNYVRIEELCPNYGLLRVLRITNCIRIEESCPIYWVLRVLRITNVAARRRVAMVPQATETYPNLGHHSWLQDHWL